MVHTMASHLELPPSESSTQRISAYLGSKTERRRVAESSNLVSGIQELKLSRGFAKKSVESLQQSGYLLEKWASGECQRNSAISDVMAQASALLKIHTDKELKFLSNFDEFIKGLLKVSDVEQIYVAPWYRWMKKFRATKNKIEEDKKRRCSEDSTTESELEQQEVYVAQQYAKRQLSEAEAAKMLFFKQTMANFANAYQIRADYLQNISNCLTKLAKFVPEITTEDITKMQYEGKPYTRELVAALRTSLDEMNSTEIESTPIESTPLLTELKDFSPRINSTNNDARNHCQGRRVHFEKWEWEQNDLTNEGENHYEVSSSSPNNQTDQSSDDELLEEEQPPQSQTTTLPPLYFGHVGKDAVFPTAPFMTPPPSAQKSRTAAKFRPSTTNKGDSYVSKPVNFHPNDVEQSRSSSRSETESSFYWSPIQNQTRQKQTTDIQQHKKAFDNEQIARPYFGKSLTKKDKKQTVVERNTKNNNRAELGPIIPNRRQINLENGSDQNSDKTGCSSLYPTLPPLSP